MTFILMDMEMVYCVMFAGMCVKAPVVQWWLILGRAAQCCSSVMNTLSHWQTET